MLVTHQPLSADRWRMLLPPFEFMTVALRAGDSRQGTDTKEVLSPEGTTRGDWALCVVSREDVVGSCSGVHKTRGSHV